MRTAYVYVVFDHHDVPISAHETRHEAIGAATRYHDANDYRVEPVSSLATMDMVPKQNRNAEYPKG